MRPQELAKLLKVTPVTLRRWAGLYNEFLSPNAQRSESQHRSYDYQDVRIFSWIASLRSENEPVDTIHEKLKASQARDWSDLPPLPKGIEHNEPVPMMPVETAVVRMDALVRERDDLKAQMAEMRTDNERLRQQLFEANQQIVELSKELTSLVRRRREPNKK